MRHLFRDNPTYFAGALECEFSLWLFGTNILYRPEASGYCALREVLSVLFDMHLPLFASVPANGARSETGGNATYNGWPLFSILFLDDRFDM